MKNRNDSFRKEKLNHFGAKEFEFLDESSSDEDSEVDIDNIRLRNTYVGEEEKSILHKS